MPLSLPNLPLSHAEAIQRALQECTRRGFHGEAVFVFQNGQLVLTRVVRSEKPPHPTSQPALSPEVSRG